MIDRINIPSPKQNRTTKVGWEGFFPYYAGYPAYFARSILESAQLPTGSVVLDPWNGSGTTTHVASSIGLTSIGCDLNPVMVIVAQARALSGSEADSIEPMTREIIRYARAMRLRLSQSDPLLLWLDRESAEFVRALERSVRHHLVGNLTILPSGTNLNRLSRFAATFYVALFSVCRELVSPFRSSNPTWLRRRRPHEPSVGASSDEIAGKFEQSLARMAEQLAAFAAQASLPLFDRGPIDIRVADSTTIALPANSVDFVLTSPPYCTRIDYTAATRIELAILTPILRDDPRELARRMIGSTLVPAHHVPLSAEWGSTCSAFLSEVHSHAAKASSGYYYRTHLDYFDKIARSFSRIQTALKPDALAIIVIQDSFYKDVHNDLPRIISEIGDSVGLDLVRTQEFRLARSMSGINPYTRAYKRRSGATEAVLCFRKRG